jgi:hypothetical protein
MKASYDLGCEKVVTENAFKSPTKEFLLGKDFSTSLKPAPWALGYDYLGTFRLQAVTRFNRNRERTEAFLLGECTPLFTVLGLRLPTSLSYISENVSQSFTKGQMTEAEVNELAPWAKASGIPRLHNANSPANNKPLIHTTRNRKRKGTGEARSLNTREVRERCGISKPVCRGRIGRRL